MQVSCKGGRSQETKDETSYSSRRHRMSVRTTVNCPSISEVQYEQGRGRHTFDRVCRWGDVYNVVMSIPHSNHRITKESGRGPGGDEVGVRMPCIDDDDNEAPSLWPFSRRRRQIIRSWHSNDDINDYSQTHDNSDSGATSTATRFSHQPALSIIANIKSATSRGRFGC